MDRDGTKAGFESRDSPDFKGIKTLVAEKANVMYRPGTALISKGLRHSAKILSLEFHSPGTALISKGLRHMIKL